jgi:hypothetical protein
MKGPARYPWAGLAPYRINHDFKYSGDFGQERLEAFWT